MTNHYHVHYHYHNSNSNPATVIPSSVSTPTPAKTDTAQRTPPQVKPSDQNKPAIQQPVTPAPNIAQIQDPLLDKLIHHVNFHNILKTEGIADADGQGLNRNAREANFAVPSIQTYSYGQAGDNFTSGLSGVALAMRTRVKDTLIYFTVQNKLKNYAQLSDQFYNNTTVKYHALFSKTLTEADAALVKGNYKLFDIKGENLDVKYLQKTISVHTNKFGQIVWSPSDNDPILQQLVAAQNNNDNDVIISQLTDITQADPFIDANNKGVKKIITVHVLLGKNDIVQYMDGKGQLHTTQKKALDTTGSSTGINALASYLLNPAHKITNVLSTNNFAKETYRNVFDQKFKDGLNEYRRQVLKAHGLSDQGITKKIQQWSQNGPDKPEATDALNTDQPDKPANDQTALNYALGVTEGKTDTEAKIKKLDDDQSIGKIVLSAILEKVKAQINSSNEKDKSLQIPDKIPDELYQQALKEAYNLKIHANQNTTVLHPILDYIIHHYINFIYNKDHTYTGLNLATIGFAITSIYNQVKASVTCVEKYTFPEVPKITQLHNYTLAQLLQHSKSKATYDQIQHLGQKKVLDFINDPNKMPADYTNDAGNAGNAIQEKFKQSRHHDIPWNGDNCSKIVGVEILNYLTNYKYADKILKIFPKELIESRARNPQYTSILEHAKDAIQVGNTTFALPADFDFIQVTKYEESSNKLDFLKHELDHIIPAKYNEANWKQYVATNITPNLSKLNNYLSEYITKMDQLQKARGLTLVLYSCSVHEKMLLLGNNKAYRFNYTGEHNSPYQWREFGDWRLAGGGRFPQESKSFKLKKVSNDHFDSILPYGSNPINSVAPHRHQAPVTENTYDINVSDKNTNYTVPVTEFWPNNYGVTNQPYQNNQGQQFYQHQKLYIPVAGYQQPIYYQTNARA